MASTTSSADSSRGWSFQDSIDTLAGYEAPADTVRVLLALSANDPVQKQAIKNQPQWSEVSKHLHIGGASNADMGRVYYRPQGGQVFAVVHRKKDDKSQRLFFRNLPSTL